MEKMTPKEICIAAIVDKALMGWKFVIRQGVNSSSRAYLHAVNIIGPEDAWRAAFHFFPIAMLETPYWKYNGKHFEASEAIELIENHLYCCLCRDA